MNGGVIGAVKLFFRGWVHIDGEPENMPMLTKCRWCGQHWVIGVAWPAHGFLLVKTSGEDYRSAVDTVEVERFLRDRYPDQRWLMDTKIENGGDFE